MSKLTREDRLERRQKRIAQAEPTKRRIRAQSIFEEALAAFRAGDLNKAEVRAHIVLGIEQRSATFDLLGQIAFKRKRYDRAIEHFRSATKLARHPMLYLNLGNALHAAGSLAEAEAAVRSSLAIDDKNAEAWRNLGALVAAQGRQREALPFYEQALALDPDLWQAGFALMAGHLAASDISEEQVFAEHMRMGMHIQKVAGEPQRTHLNERSPNRRLRIGFISPDFCFHAVSHFLEPVLAELVKRDDLEIHCYANQIRAADATTARLRGLVPRWAEIQGMPDEAAARLIQSDGIDILIDLAGHTSGNRLPLMARRPAPVSCTMIGYPHTTGLHSIDYRIVDIITDPAEAPRSMTEEPWWMAGGPFLCYRPPPDGADLPVPPMPHLRLGRVTFGSFNASHKISPATIEAWARILTGVPSARFVLKSPDLADDRNRAHFREAFKAHGIEADRLVFMGPTPTYREHLERYAEIDIALDPFPYNGTTTTAEALWMGRPVITMIGDSHRGRVGASLLASAGFHHWLAEDVDDYVRRAIAMTELPAVAGGELLRRNILLASALADADGMSKRLATAWRRMWHRWCDEGPRQTEAEAEALREEAQFVEFVGTLREASRAQLQQDLWAVFETRAQREGFFVEFGATDGASISNTWLLEERFGWRGILAEPNPVWHGDLMREGHRSRSAKDLRCVWSRTGERVNFRATAAAELAGVEETLAVDANTPAREAHETIEVETISLVDLLGQHQAPKTIDFLSIDTEGSELEILRAFFANPRGYRIRLIAVEHNFTEARAALDRLLLANGYEVRFAGLSRWDRWARLRES